jgi:predicted O-methyltransferase YrrM
MLTEVMDKRALVDQLLERPPAIHAMNDEGDPELGVWSTDRDCYLFLTETVRPGSRTLETGSGLSTILFAALGAEHTCVTPAQVEVDRIVEYCRQEEIDISRVAFEIGSSDEVLPRLLSGAAIDLAFVDGCHGFPTPTIDRYYAGSRLRQGGLLVVDDVALPAVAEVCGFIDLDPRWAASRRTGKWAAYRRVDAGGLRQDWFEQPFFRRPPVYGMAAFAGHLARRAHARLWRRRRWSRG